MTMKRDVLRILLYISIVAVLASCGESKLHWQGGHYVGETADGMPQGYGVWKSDDGSAAYQGFWISGMKSGNGTFCRGGFRYKGHFASDKYSGYGELTYNDSVLYTGMWSKGARQGIGCFADTLGRKINGVWNADTLVTGERRDSDGVYHGQMTREGIANGHGRYISSDGDIYEGRWKDGCRSGFGFSLSYNHHVRAGEWKSDRYLGERITYTSERIYGIDISKYQHVIGRRKYRIDWGRLRIVHLGTISKKKVNGTVDYPISFVYIKSTEGKRMYNHYYAADYVQAHKHGYRCGTYHFFSTISSPVLQANNFVRHSYFRKGDFPPVLDVEPSHAQVAKMGGRGALMNAILTWMRIVQNRVGKRPILYVSQTFVNKYLVNEPQIRDHYMVWIARYGEYKPDVKLIYWQLCPDGEVRGIRGKVDINVFNGYADQFREFKNTKTIGN